jgi:hypothetical protein
MASLSLQYHEKPINQRGDQLSLTDMWRAAGSDPSKQPAKWREQDGTKTFVSHIACILLVGEDALIQTLRGNEAGTWAHWQIAMAYAKYLSPEFHAWCNSVVKAHMEGRGVPVQATGAIIAFSEDRFFEALASAMTPVTAGIVAILEKQNKTDTRVDRVEMDVCAIKHDVIALRADVQQIATKGRRKIKDSVKAEIVKHTGLLGQRCPCCGINEVITYDGTSPFAEFDHFYQNSLPDTNHVWLICKPCHTELTTGRIQRGDRQAEFNAFQAKRQRLPGAQPILQWQAA